MDDLVVQAASSQQRVVRPDPRPKPAGYGNRLIDEYIAHYHEVTDVAKPEWNLEGAVDDVQLLLRVGYGLAAGARYPEWKPGAEFKAVRDAMMKQPD